MPPSRISSNIPQTTISSSQSRVPAVRVTILLLKHCWRTDPLVYFTTVRALRNSGGPQAVVRKPEAPHLRLRLKKHLSRLRVDLKRNWFALCFARRALERNPYPEFAGWGQVTRTKKSTRAEVCKQILPPPFVHQCFRHPRLMLFLAGCQIS